MSLFKKLFSGKSKPEATQKSSTQSGNSEMENQIRIELEDPRKKIMLCEVRTHMTSHQGADAENAFRAAGIMDENLRSRILETYTWHYLDDMDENLQCTMQLVLTEVLEQAKPFVDSRAIYEEVTGIKYKGFDD